MDTLASLGGAFVNICHPTFSPLMVAGVAVGIIFGSVPGLSATMAITLSPPLVFDVMSFVDVNLLVIVYIGDISGGLISATLLNLPGTTSSIATCFDGHPMAKNRKTGRALGYGIVFSFLGSVLLFLVLTSCAPLLADIALKPTLAGGSGISFFVPIMMAVLASGSTVKGVPAGVLGLIFTLIGIVPINRTPRFTSGSNSLMAGFDTLPTLIGISATPEIPITTESMGDGKAEAVEMKFIKGFGFTWKEFVHQTPSVIRSVLIGTGIGILPGVGGSTSSMLSYVIAKSMSKHSDESGRGCSDGIVTTETANNATIGGAMIPLLVLSISGDGVTTMVLGGFLIHGLSVGPLLFVENADVAYGILVAYMLCSPFVLIVESFGIKGFVQPLKTPKRTLMPLIPVLYCVGACITNNRIFDVQSVILLGTVGCLYRKSKLPATPFVLCFLIGGMVEIYPRHGITQYKSFGVFFKRPIFDVSSLVVVTVMVWPTYKERRMIRTRKMQHALKWDK